MSQHRPHSPVTAKPKEGTVPSDAQPSARGSVNAGRAMRAKPTGGNKGPVSVQPKPGDMRTTGLRPSRAVSGAMRSRAAAARQRSIGGRAGKRSLPLLWIVEGTLALALLIICFSALRNGTGKASVADELPRAVNWIRYEYASTQQRNEDIILLGKPYPQGFTMLPDDRVSVTYGGFPVEGKLTKSYVKANRACYTIKPTGKSGNWSAKLWVPADWKPGNPCGLWLITVTSKDHGFTYTDWFDLRPDGTGIGWYGGGDLTSMDDGEREAMGMPCQWRTIPVADGVLLSIDCYGVQIVAHVVE